MEEKKQLERTNHQLKKQYEEHLKHGTILKITVSVEVDKLCRLDYLEVLSQFAANSHEFYLSIAKTIKSKL